MGFFNSIQFTAMNTIAIADLRDSHTSSGNSLLAVNQQLSVGFGIAIGLIILKVFENNTAITQGVIHLAFRYTFFTVGFLTIFTGLVFRRLHWSDGENMKSQV
jgi:fucose permease